MVTSLEQTGIHRGPRNARGEMGTATRVMDMGFGQSQEPKATRGRKKRPWGPRCKGAALRDPGGTPVATPFLSLPWDAWGLCSQLQTSWAPERLSSSPLPHRLPAES